MNDDDIQVSVLFGVPLYRRRITDFVERQQRITECLLALRSRDAGVLLSNERGWHSREDLRGCENADLQWLMGSLNESAGACIRAFFERNRPHGPIRMLAAWANINQDGAWNLPHIPQWSGVFYVQAGEREASEPGSSSDGNILFFDPLPLGERFRRPTTLSMAPEEGMMLLFPSYLNHR